MNKEEVVKHMISYIEEAERDLLAANLAGESKPVRTNIINSILNKLDQEVQDEN